MAWLPSDAVLATRAQLQALMAEFPFASCVPFANKAVAGGEERQGLLFRAAAYNAVPIDLLERIEALLQMQTGEVVRYADVKRGQRRAMRMQRAGSDTHLDSFLLAGDTSAQTWISGLLTSGQDAQAYGRALLAPGSKPPLTMVSSGQVVCTCFNVTYLAIDTYLQKCAGTDKERLTSLQSTLQCGTSCGSCVPQLQRMVRLGKTQKAALETMS